MIITWEPTDTDVLTAHALGVSLNDRCGRCHYFLCVCFENEQADVILDNAITQVGKTGDLHANYDYE